MSRTWAALLWLLSRGLVLWLFFGPEAWVTGDVAYFANSLTQVPDNGLAATLVEYPLPGVALVAFPWAVSEWVGRPDLYAELVLVLAALTDAAFTVLLHRFGRSGRAVALWLWLLAVPLLGATTYARFDLVPGILAGVAVLLLVERPRVAAAAGAVATGLKLWPALLLPALAARSRGRRAVVGTVAVLGVLLAFASLALAGWSRLVSPLTWQADRGLQIESVLATPAMLAWAWAPDQLAIGYSDYNAYQVSGPGVSALLGASNVLTVLLVVALVVLWARAWRAGDGLGVDAVVWTCLAAVSGFMVTSKVLSPQYLLWLLPVAAAGLAVSETRAQRDLRRWGAVLLATTGVTHLVFPVYYGALTQHTEQSVAVVLLLAARNLALVWLSVWAGRRAWAVQRRVGPQRGSELDRQPAAPNGKDAPTLR
ncbi:MAG TPA: glycosyltransferase 87 family protein [Nocardioidaceae bacterium]|nr:glycosyltransferase 87 family protein [Nocardioidaceae bacterium]